MGTALWEKRLRGVFITYERQRNTGNNEKLKREEKQYDEIMEKNIVYGIGWSYAFFRQAL